MPKIFKLLLLILLCQLAGLIGSVFTFSAIPNWYAGLVKPSFNPPNWLFGPVWTTLYTMMGVALFLIIEKGKGSKKKIAIKIFTIQLALNALWSIIFFGFKLPGLAFLEIIILWIFIVLSIKKFWPISKTSAYLLIPYLLWVSFASVLNFSIFSLN